MKEVEKLKMKNHDEILISIKTVDVDKCATEILQWLIANVENYIDNSEKFYKVDLILDNVQAMSETQKLQDLYKAIPDDPGLSEEDIKRSVICRTELNNVVAQVFQRLNEKEDLLQQLFKRLAFYYEMTGFSHGTPLIKTLEGSVQIIKFDYDPFEIRVSSDHTNFEAEDSYTIPEGFMIWFEIAFKQNIRPTTLF